MLMASEVVGNPEDWANFITLSDEHQTPILRNIRKDKKPADVLCHYQAKTYADPSPSNYPEGKDWDAFDKVENRAELKARMQRFDKTAAVSWKAQEATLHTPENLDELAEAIADKMVEMSRTIEATISSSQAAYEDDGAVQDKTQGIGLWVQSGTTNQLYLTPASVRPAAAQIYTGTKANLDEDALIDLLKAQWKATGTKGSLRLYVGEELKQRISNFVRYVGSDVSTQSTWRVSNRDAGSNSLGYMVDVYKSDFGTFQIELSNWLEHANFGGTTGKNSWFGYGLNSDMWAWGWHTKPKVFPQEFKGGSYKAAIMAAGALKCLNPVGEVAIKPSDA